MAEPVPANLRPYVDALGEDLAVKFFLRFGGAPLYIAERPQLSSDLVYCIGVEMVVALARTVGPGHISRVPINRQWIAHRLKANGRSILAIARELHVSDVTVRKWLTPADARQLSLFSSR